MTFKLLLIVLLSSLAAVFVAQNAAVVEIAFLFWRTSMSSSLLIFFSLIAGFILGWFLHAYLLHRRSMSNKGELVYLP
jgi:putative membrane protein